MDPQLAWQVGEGAALLGVTAAVLVFIVEPCCSRILGKVVKTFLQSIDRRILGVNVSFGHLKVNPCCLQVNIDGLTVDNPEGYDSPYLLKMDDVHVRFSLRRLLFSCGRRISVRELQLDGVDVNVEKSLRSSNLQDVLAFLAAKATPQPQDRERMERLSDSDDLEYAAKKPKDKAESKARKVDIHAVVVHRASVSLQAWMFKMKLRAADLDFQDLTEDIKGHETTVVAQLLLESLLMSVLANLPAGDYVQQAWDRRRQRDTSCTSSDSEASTYSLFSGASGSSGESASDTKSPCCCN